MQNQVCENHASREEEGATIRETISTGKILSRITEPEKKIHIKYCSFPLSDQPTKIATTQEFLLPPSFDISYFFFIPIIHIR
jgi:hypothetical protein